MTVSINGDGTITGLVITTADLADSSVTTAKIAAGAVATVDIADNAVTAAKLAREGSSGQVLTSNGAGSDPSYQSLPAGGVTSLNGQTGAITNTTLGAIGSVVTGVVSGYYNSGSSFTLGATYASVQAYTVNINAQVQNIATQSGTWRCIGGVCSAYAGGTAQGAPQSNMLQGLFIRVS